MSLHPTMTNDDLFFIIDAIMQIGKNHKKWVRDYSYDKHTNEFTNLKPVNKYAVDFKKWFKI